MFLNPGIVKTVEWLNANGFPTCDSGDGETHDAEYDRAWAYVVIQLDSPDNMAQEATRLLERLVSEGVEVHSIGLEFPYIQVDFDPVVGLAFIQLVGLSDKDWLGPAKAEMFLEELNRMAPLILEKRGAKH